MRSLNTGVIGLGVEQNAMDVISNNISNVNTIGYKSERVEFQSLLSQTLKEASAPKDGIGGTNPEQVGVGVTTGAVTKDLTEGAFQYTGKNTDLALSGDGYFVVSDGSKNHFTRDGSFDFDSNGNFIQPSDGMKVMGWPATNGLISTEGAISPLNIPRTMTLAPQQTGNITLKGNLDASAQDISLAGVIRGSTTAGVASPDTPVNVCLRFMNSKNQVMSGNLTLAQEGTSQTWDLSFTPDATTAGNLTTGATAISLGKVTFDSTGKVAQNGVVPLTVAYTAANGADSQVFNLDPGNLQIRTDALATQIGFSNALTGSGEPGIPAGDKGLVYAGGYTMTVDFFDSTGTKHTGSMVFMRDLDQQATVAGSNNPVEWRGLFTINDSTVKDDVSGVGAGGGPFPIDMGNVTFSNGTLKTSSLNTATIKYVNGATPSALVFNVGTPGDINGLSQLQSDSTALVDSQDGYPVGSLSGLSVDDAGVVTGVFSNGQSRKLAQVAVAKFANPEGLLDQGHNLFDPSNDSGLPLIGSAGTDGRGTVSSGNLEQSNVDLAKQFADLIVTQRAFQANARIVSASDDILQELIQLKQG